MIRVCNSNKLKLINIKKKNYIYQRPNILMTHTNFSILYKLLDDITKT